MTLALMLALLAPVATSPTDQLSGLVGNWDIYDRRSIKVGTSKVVAEAPGSMLLEMRRVDGDALPLWWENSERDRGWIQLFVGPGQKIRAFTPISTPGEWPMVIGCDTVLQSGEAVKFKMTMTNPASGRSSRRLEISKDGGRSWATVFDYDYRRAVR